MALEGVRCLMDKGGVAKRGPGAKAFRITTLIRTGALHLHETADLRPESFWSVEKTNAGESELHNLGGALAVLREPLRTGHKKSGRLATPPPTPYPNPEPELARISAPPLEFPKKSLPR